MDFSGCTSTSPNPFLSGAMGSLRANSPLMRKRHVTKDRRKCDLGSATSRESVYTLDTSGVELQPSEVSVEGGFPFLDSASASENASRTSSPRSDNMEVRRLIMEKLIKSETQYIECLQVVIKVWSLSLSLPSLPPLPIPPLSSLPPPSLEQKLKFDRKAAKFRPAIVPHFLAERKWHNMLKPCHFCFLSKHSLFFFFFAQRVRFFPNSGIRGKRQREIGHWGGVGGSQPDRRTTFWSVGACSRLFSQQDVRRLSLFFVSFVCILSFIWFIFQGSPNRRELVF